MFIKYTKLNLGPICVCLYLPHKLTLFGSTFTWIVVDQTNLNNVQLIKAVTDFISRKNFEHFEIMEGGKRQLRFGNTTHKHTLIIYLKNNNWTHFLSISFVCSWRQWIVPPIFDIITCDTFLRILSIGILLSIVIKRSRRGGGRWRWRCCLVTVLLAILAGFGRFNGNQVGATI